MDRRSNRLECVCNAVSNCGGADSPATAIANKKAFFQPLALLIVPCKMKTIGDMVAINAIRTYENLRTFLSKELGGILALSRCTMLLRYVMLPVLTTMAVQEPVAMLQPARRTLLWLIRLPKDFTGTSFSEVVMRRSCFSTGSDSPVREVMATWR